MKQFKVGKIMTGSGSMNPKVIAERAEKIYNEKYREKFEKRHFGKFVIIEVATEEAFLGDSPEKALEAAREKAPQGLYHLIKVGSPGAFRVSYNSSDIVDWVFQ